MNDALEAFDLTSAADDLQTRILSARARLNARGGNTAPNTDSASSSSQGLTETSDSQTPAFDDITTREKAVAAREAAVVHYHRYVEDKMEEFEMRMTKAMKEAMERQQNVHAQMDAAAAENEALKRDVARLTEAERQQQSTEGTLEQLKEARAMADAFQKENHTKEATIKSTLAKLHNIRTHRDTLQHTLSDLQSKHTAAQTALKKAEAALRAQRTQGGGTTRTQDEEDEVLRLQRALGTRVRTLEDERSALMTKVLDAEQENRDLLLTRQELRSAHEDALDALREENEGVVAKLRKRVRTLTDRLEERDSEYGELEKDLDAKEARVRRLKDKLKEQQIQIVNLKLKTTPNKVSKQPTAARADSAPVQDGEESVEYLKRELAAAVSAAESAADETVALKTKIVRLEGRLKMERLAVSDLKKQREQDAKTTSDRVKRASKRQQPRINELEAENKVLEEKIKELQDGLPGAVSEARQEFHRENGNAAAHYKRVRQERNKLQQDLEFAQNRILAVTLQRDELRKRVIVLEGEQEGDEPEDDWEGDEEEEDDYEDEWWDGGYDGYDEEEAQAARQERGRYLKFMASLPPPDGDDRPPYTTLLPVHAPTRTQDPVLRRNLPNSNLRGVYFPKRTIWCNTTSRLHALVFCPTKQYKYPTDKFEEVDMARWCGTGEHFEFFMHHNRDGLAYYVGTYVMHSMRTLQPPGSVVPPDVSRKAVLFAVGLGRANRERITECYVDGVVKTECFGMQCVGFNLELYRSMRQNFLAAQRKLVPAPASGLGWGVPEKRKAGEEDLRGTEGAKRVQMSFPFKATTPASPI